MRAVGFLSPGDMGHTVAQVLIGRGMPVFTNLSGRSDRTRTLARSVGTEDVLSYEELVRGGGGLRRADEARRGVLDVKMPVIGGQAALRKLLALSPPPKVVIVTVLADRRLVQELLALGASAYLSKNAPIRTLASSTKGSFLRSNR